MSQRIHAGVEFYRNTLRYAEVEHTDSAYRLLRLGSCIFDFDVEQQLFDLPSPLVLKQVADALQDVLKGSHASSLRFSVHPNYAISFFSPIDADLSPTGRAKQFLSEARQLYGKTSEPLHIVPYPLFIEELESGESVDWYQVTVVARSFYNQFTEMVKPLPIQSYEFHASSVGVASVLKEKLSVEKKLIPEEAPFILVIGCYENHTEYALCRPQNLHFGNYTITSTPEESAYYASILLERMHLVPEAIGRIFVYGDTVKMGAYSMLESIFNTKVIRLDPSSFLNIEKESLSTPLDLDVFSPCIGVTL